MHVLPADVTSNVLEGLNLDDFFAWTDTSGTVALLPDGLPGSTLGVVNSSGSISTTYSYQPFGQTTTTGSSTNQFEFDNARGNLGHTGLYYFRARYYDPTLQRFISTDPLGFGGGDTNLYAFVHNDRINFSDPLGLGGGGVWDLREGKTGTADLIASGQDPNVSNKGSGFATWVDMATGRTKP